MMKFCPQCGGEQLESRAVYYDALVSDMVDCYQYTCQGCWFVFSVAETQDAYKEAITKMEEAIHDLLDREPEKP